MLITAWLVLGLLLGAAYLALIARFKPQTERKLIALGLVIAALVYFVFALLWGDSRWLLIETSGVVVYGLLAWFGWRFSSLWLAVGWGTHPFWDVLLHLFGSGVAIAPTWYVVACITFDMLVAASVVKRRSVLDTSTRRER